MAGNSVLMTGNTSRVNSSSVSGSKKTVRRPMVRKIGYVSAPVDPLRSGSSRATRKTVPATSQTVGNVGMRKTVEDAERKKVIPSVRKRAEEAGERQAGRRGEQKPPHNRSWALRPSASSIMVAAAGLEDSSETLSERRGLIPLGTHGEKSDGGREMAESDRGRERTDLAQILKELQSSSSAEEDMKPQSRSERRQTTKWHLHSSASTAKRQQITGELHARYLAMYMYDDFLFLQTLTFVPYLRQYAPNPITMLMCKSVCHQYISSV